MLVVSTSSYYYDWDQNCLFFPAESVAQPTAEKPSIPVGHQTHSEARKPLLPLTNIKKPISQAEFQALLDAGYKVS